MTRHGFALIELLIAVIIVGILATLATQQYNNMAEKARSTEVYPLFKLIRQGYLLRKAQGLTLNGMVWNPNLDGGEESNSAWMDLGVSNPNADPTRYFTCDVWDNIWSQTHPPVNADRYVVISFRRLERKAWSDADLNRWIYMDLDTGEIFKSTPY